MPGSKATANLVCSHERRRAIASCRVMFTHPRGPELSKIIDSDGVFLRPNVKMELLVGRWFAWPHLVSPVQHALNLAFRYLPILQSFVSNPKVHIAASKDRRFVGGPFVDLPESAIPEIKELINKTRTQCAELISFANDFKHFDQLIQDSAHGFCLHEFYERLPKSLAGVVELAYDINNHPTIKLLEEIIYKYGIDNRFTHELLLHDTVDSDRKFFMSTPRLLTDTAFLAKVAFSSPILDELSSLRTHPGPLDHAAGIFGGSAIENPRFRALFTKDVPQRNAPHYNGSEVRIRYFGHACVLIQSARTTILIDPTVTWDANAEDGRYTYIDLPELDRLSRNIPWSPRSF